MAVRLFWLNTTYACGGVLTDDQGRVTGACPIYRRFVGQHLNDVVRRLRRAKQLLAWKACNP